MDQELVHEEVKDGFTIKLYLLPEYDKPDWDFQSKEEEQEVLRKIENGLLLWFTAKVTASKLGVELAADYLGQCIYPSVNEFISGDYYDDMVNNVIAEAKKVIINLNKD